VDSVVDMWDKLEEPMHRDMGTQRYIFAIETAVPQSCRATRLPNSNSRMRIGQLQHLSMYGHQQHAVASRCYPARRVRYSGRDAAWK
jgi:hypothetical protein